MMRMSVLATFATLVLAGCGTGNSDYNAAITAAFQQDAQQVRGRTDLYYYMENVGVGPAGYVMMVIPLDRLFVSGKTELLQDSKIDGYADILKSYSSHRYEIIVHSDGSVTRNEELAQGRATVVVQAFHDLGIPKSRLSVKRSGGAQTEEFSRAASIKGTDKLLEIIIRPIQ